MGVCACMSAATTVKTLQHSSPETQLSNERLKAGIRASLLDMKKVNSVGCLSLEASPLYRRRIEGGKSTAQDLEVDWKNWEA